MPAVRSGVAGDTGDREAGKEVRPAVGMAADLGLGQAGVAEVDPGAAADRSEPELDRGRSGGQMLAAREPQETTTRLGRSTRRYSPRTGWPAMSTANLPPGVGSRSAYCPIHAVMPAFVVRYSNTVSGDAAMSM